MSSKKQIKKQTNQIINNANKGVENVVNNEQGSFICYRLNDGKKLSFIDAIDKISNQVDEYNKLSDTYNKLLEEYKKLGAILLDRDNLIESLQKEKEAFSNLKDDLENTKKDLENAKKIIEEKDKVIANKAEQQLNNTNVVEGPNLPINNYNPQDVEEKVFYLETNNDLFNNSLSIKHKRKTKPRKIAQKIVIDEKIDFTKSNLNLVKVSGVGTNRKNALIDNLDKIKSLDDILKIKIGIGKKTLENIKEIFREPNNDFKLHDNNLPLDDNLPFY
jgi:hypothetical protein